MSSENKLETPKQLLADWSKWLIAINFSAATGCIIALKSAGTAQRK